MPMTRRPQHASAATTNAPSLVTRNLRLGRGRTSIRLEHLEWAALDAICAVEGIDRHQFATQVDRDPMRREKTLTSRVRSAILAYFVVRSGVGVTGIAGTGIAGALQAATMQNAALPNGHGDRHGFSAKPPAAGQEESRN